MNAKKWTIVLVTLAGVGPIVAGGRSLAPSDRTRAPGFEPIDLVVLAASCRLNCAALSGQNQ